MNAPHWTLYNHALVPTTSPHTNAFINEIYDYENWIFARYTTDFDCDIETSFWYCISDEPFDINKLKAKRRYEITRGVKNYSVKLIDPLKYTDEMYNVMCSSAITYPAEYRVIISEQEFNNMCITNYSKCDCFGAFSNLDGKLYGYSICEKHSDWIAYEVQKTSPDMEKTGINAALTYKILCYYPIGVNDLYICDGCRNIRHKTNFQNYLEKYFGFRKAYCNLHIIYSRQMKLVVNLLYPCRKIIAKSHNKLIYNVYSVLFQEELHRKCKERSLDGKI